MSRIERPLKILQVSTADRGGGAEKVASNLFQEYRRRGHHSWLAVAEKRTDDPGVFLITHDPYRSRWAKAWLAVGSLLTPFVGRVRGMGRLQTFLRRVGEPRRVLQIFRGYEDFEFPGTWHLLEMVPEPPDIVHGHNLHVQGGYFDLRALPWLSHQVPVVLTLHDAWLLSGHCAHSFDCDRWKTGCGQCPDLTIYPSIPRDATASNWERKREIYAKSRLHIATPSRWLMEKVRQSMLAAAEVRVIPHGVDLTIFRPAPQSEARWALRLPLEARILLFVGNTTRSNRWKDYPTLEKAVLRAAEQLPRQRILLVCLGEERAPSRIGQTQVDFVGYQNDPKQVAKYYQAADVYVHAALVDTFPNTVLEALACGVPVVATAVGGIPEQVKALRIGEWGVASANLPIRDPHSEIRNLDATGVLVPPEDPEAMAEAIMTLLTDERLHQQLGENAAEDANQRFDLQRQVDEYLEWYHELLIGTAGRATSVIRPSGSPGIGS